MSAALASRLRLTPSFCRRAALVPLLPRYATP